MKINLSHCSSAIILGIGLILSTTNVAARASETETLPNPEVIRLKQSNPPTQSIAQSPQLPNQPNGCLTGYEDGTFRGNQPVSRYEFAAGLNACLNQVEQLLRGSTAELATDADLEPIIRQLETNRQQLDNLRGRIDPLDGGHQEPLNQRQN